jgi:hypothetical protein
MERTKCAVCNTEHNVLYTKDIQGNVIGEFCPVKKRMIYVTTDTQNGVNVVEALRAFIPMFFTVKGLSKMHDTSIQKLSRRVAYVFMLTPLAASNSLSYYFVQYHAYNVLKEYANSEKGLTA